MKTMLTKYVVLFAALLIISGCTNPFEQPQTKNSPAEKGSFSLVIDGVRAGRTIMPEIQETALIAYSLAFFSETDDSVIMVDRTADDLQEPVMLYAGTWNLLVTAYLDAERTKPAAQGSLSGIEITSGGNASGSITLSQITEAGSGQGTFSWEIDYPNEVTTASMAITRLSGSDETPVIDGTVNKEDSLSLNAGYYRVIFTLIDNTNKSVRWVEILHIYDGMDSAFTHEFTQDQFLYTIYTITFDSQGGTTVPSQSVYRNTTAAHPVRPTRSSGSINYNFTGWYTSATTGAPLYDFSSLVTQNITLYAKWTQADPEGIYVGIIKFADVATDITTSSGTPPISLTSNRSTLVSRLSSSYSKASTIGTTMFYAVHRALANLKNREAYYPTNIDSVSIITFTDGLDNQSAGLSRLSEYTIEGKQFANNVLYAEYVRDEIENRKIADIPITAYSVGVRGSDVTDPEAFLNNLIAIASPGNHNELTNFADVQSIFDGIADGLNIVQGTTATFTMVTTLLDEGTRVRMTFDLDVSNNSASAGTSQRYIEGTIGSVDNTYTFNNITYVGGISSAAGAGPLIGTRSGTRVNFVFNNITLANPNTGVTAAYNPAANQTRQWLIQPGSSVWGPNTEYDSTGSSTTNIEKRSAIIYLVLDCSTSLSDTQVTQIRTAATSFINSLYDRYTNNTTVGGGSRQITIAMWDSAGDGWDGSAALRISVNGTNRATNARLSSGSSGSYNFGVNPGDVVSLYWVNGGQYDYECAFAVYYSNDPPSPMFNPSSGTTGGKVLISKRYNSPSGAVGSGTNMGSFTVY